MIDPVFGRKDPKLDYHTRIGAYGVIPDHSGARLLILQAPNHALFLPGGGVEEGETPGSHVGTRTVRRIWRNRSCHPKVGQVI